MSTQAREMELREALEHIAEAGKRENRLLERLGYVFERFPRNLKEAPPTDEDRWEYLAFHIHTDIWQLAQRAEAALASPSQDGETPREGENWWDEAANDVMRHAKASNPPDWKNAITGGLLRAFNRGRAAKDLPGAR